MHNTKLEVLLRTSTIVCNATPKCPYCLWKHRHNVGSPPLSPEYWMRGLLTLGERYNPMFIDACGEGEMFAGDMTFSATLALLAHDNWVVITTNLIADDFEFTPFKRSPVSLQVSYHPYHWGLNDEDGTRVFCNKINSLREKYEIEVAYVSMVAYPPTLPIMKSRLAMITDLTGVSTVCGQYSGRYDSKTYPTAYTDDERAIMAESGVILNRSPWTELQHPLGQPALYNSHTAYPSYTGSTRGLPCWAGKTGVYIDETGSIYPCVNAKERLLGHLSNCDSFSLLDEPHVCTSFQCGCAAYLRHLAQDPFGEVQ